ncbi:MAG TPA: exonuclease domain-containing protein [Gemmatirosa sp.]|nr:exonuclease domain-containing protein [Gemmatirosa sp.]
MSMRPADTLLVARARDFLAGGPADAGTLVARVCQLPGVGPAMASRIADELLGAHREFVREADGRWALAGDSRIRGREVGGPRGAAPSVPSFDEWRAARAAAGGTDTPPGAEPGRRARRSRRRADEVLPAAPLPGDDDRLDTLPYVVVDVETTGGSPDHGHRITEIAAVVVRGGEVREVYETLVNPERGIPPQIVRLTGISWEMVRDERPFRDVAPDVTAALAGHVFVAHNVAFDWRFVTHEVARATGQQLDGRRLCTVRLARKLLPQLRSRSLGHVADWYGADAFAATYFEARHGRARPWRHSAAGDAVATAHCLLRLLDEAHGHGVTTWGELDRWLSAGTGAARRRRSAMPAPATKDTTA